VHALLDTNPDFRSAGIDLFACGSTLGNLLRFARGVDRVFRFSIESIGNTVFFIRKENDSKELIEDVRGFGHTFPEAYTTWESDVRGSDTHQRIVQYEFGGLKCLVRFESDGYIQDSSMGEGSIPIKPPADEDDLLQTLRGTAISQPLEASSSKTDVLLIKHGGSAVPQHSIFDLKTRSGKYKKEIDMSDIYPLLWLKQIPNFIVAYHDGAGLFEDIRVQDVKKRVQKWEKDNKDGIRRFAIILEKVLDIARSNREGLLEVYCPGADRLEIRSQYGKGIHALPTELNERWADGKFDADSTKQGAPDDDDEDDDDRIGGGGYRFNSDEVRFGYDYGGYSDYEDRDDSEPDYTACSAEDCGYCGKCTY
jgi:hypothetical protein